jgi:hypothetical protein
MGRYDAEKLLARAEKLEAQITDPANKDDPNWLRWRAARLRRWAARREKGHEQREQEKAAKKRGK